MLSFSSYTIYLPLTFFSSSNSNDNESVGQIYSTVINAMAKFRNLRRASDHPALMGNYPTCSHILKSMNLVIGLLLVRPRWYAVHEML